MLEADSRDFLIAVLPEAILCTREVGETARKSAYELIVAMCEANIGWKSECEISGKIIMSQTVTVTTSEKDVEYQYYNEILYEKKVKTYV